MESNNDFQLPVEMLGRFLHFLAMDGASAARQHLAYCTHKNDTLRNIADKMQRPLVLRVAFDGEGETKFILPFRMATVARIEIDWGDDSPIQIINEVGNGSAEHEYKAAGEYTVTVLPHGPSSDGVWLDHLGCSESDSYQFLKCWWRPLRTLDTLGSLGISSLHALFKNAHEFDQPLSQLDVSEVKNMSYMFYNAQSFNHPIGNWNTSNVTDMTSMFRRAAKFNQDIGRWNVSRVVSMRNLFFHAESFNKPLGDWDTSKVKDMSTMFFSCFEFDQDISQWNVSNVTDMSSMFYRAHAFNQPIGCWNVSNVERMEVMFSAAQAFNQPIGEWDVRSVTDMTYMFAEASQFNQDIGDWNVSNLKSARGMFIQADKFDLSCIDRWNLSPDIIASVMRK